MAAPTPRPSITTRLNTWLRSPSVWEVAAIVAFTAWIAWPFVAPGGYVSDYDTGTYSGPNMVALFRAWGEHRVPFWEPGLFGGTAFAANLQTAVFYPLKVLVWPLGAATAMGVMTAVHLTLLAFGMRHLARRTLALAPPAGAVAAIVMVGSGATMVRSVRFEQIAVIAWTPWLLVALDAVIVARPGRRMGAVAACAAVLALVLLSGHPQQIHMGAVLAAVWVVARLIDHRATADTDDDERVLPRLGRLAGAGALGVGIAALPLITAVPLLSRTAVPSSALLEQARLDIYRLGAFDVVTSLFGDPWSFHGPTSFPSPESPAYIGVAVIALAVVGAAVALTRRVAFTQRLRVTTATLVIASYVSVQMALGPHERAYRLAVQYLPGMAYGRVPLRWLFVTTFAVAVLAAMGAAALVRVVPSRPALILAAIGLAIIAYQIVTTPTGDDGVAPSARTTWLVALLVVAGATVVAALRPPDDPRRVVAAIVAVAFIALELGVPARHSFARELRRPESFVDAANNPTNTFLAEHGDRYLAVGNADVNSTLTWGGRTLDGYDGGLWLTNEYVAAGDQLTDRPFDPMGRLADQVALPLDGPALARFGIRYVVINPHDKAEKAVNRAPRDGEVAIARQQLVPGWTGPVLVDGNREIWENPDFDSEAIVYPTGSDAAPTTLGVPAVANRPGPGQIDVTTSGAGGRLVVAEQALPGWTVTVDGEPAALVTTDGFALAVDVPPGSGESGSHDVQFRYRSPGLGVGLAVSLISIAIAVALAVLGRRGRRGADAAV